MSNNISAKSWIRCIAMLAHAPDYFLSHEIPPFHAAIYFQAVARYAERLPASDHNPAIDCGSLYTKDNANKWKMQDVSAQMYNLEQMPYTGPWKTVCIYVGANETSVTNVVW